MQADSDTIALRMTSDGQIDLWDFAAHMAEGDVIAAAALYRDDFLGGVLLGDSDDFERWATQQREFYRRGHRRARKPDPSGRSPVDSTALRLPTPAVSSASTRCRKAPIARP
ncbi:MAG: hypothetical protein R2854_20040 [Caldilineaceae bacterium]